MEQRGSAHPAGPQLLTCTCRNAAHSRKRRSDGERRIDEGWNAWPTCSTACASSGTGRNGLASNVLTAVGHHPPIVGVCVPGTPCASGEHARSVQQERDIHGGVRAGGKRQHWWFSLGILDNAAEFRGRRGDGRRRVCRFRRAGGLDTPCEPGQHWRQWKLCLGRGIGSMFERCNKSRGGFGPQGKWPCHVSERAS